MYLLSIFSSNDLVVVHFYADWATQCGPMNDVLEELAKQAELKVSISAFFL
jgi:Thioredoxin.